MHIKYSLDYDIPQQPLIITALLVEEMSMQHNHHVHEHGDPGHQESHHHDFAQANRHHFDETAKDFDSFPHAISRGERYVNLRVNIVNITLIFTSFFFGKKRFAEAIRKEYVFDKEVTTVMEYACGTGLEFFL